MQPTSARGPVPPDNPAGIDVLDEQRPTTPPRGLLQRRAHIGFWLGLALLLGAIIALLLIGIASD